MKEFEELSKEAEKLENEIGLDIDDILNKFTQEVGEFNDAVQKLRGRYCRSKINIEEVKKEAGDVLFNLISICNRIGINPNELPELAEKTFEKFIKRKQDYINMLKKK